MRRVAVVVVLGCASCRAVFGLEPPAREADASIADTIAVDGPPNDSQSAACNPDTDLVACFEFEGSVVDLAPSPNSVTASNVSFAFNGVSGQALAVDMSSRVTIADSVLLDVPEITIEAWVRLTQPPPALGRVGIFDVNGQYAMFIRDGLQLRCTTGATFDVGTIPLDTWTHVACTAANNAAIGYINGTATATVVYSGSLPTTATDGGEIGGGSPGPGERLVGRIDILRVYRVARSGEKICTDAGEMGCL